MKPKITLPSARDLMQPTLQVLHVLGGSATITEIEQGIIEFCRIANKEAEALHASAGSGTRTELGYRLAWARTALKNAGFVSNSERGIWNLTAQGRSSLSLDSAAVINLVSRNRRSRGIEPKKRSARKISEAEIVNEIDLDAAWKVTLSKTLQKMDPIAFERLAQRLLRESGFESVTVTSPSNDSGIDGYGDYLFDGLLRFHVQFQCKRYTRRAVGAPDIRDFRGSIGGHTDKALFITTSRFTKAAKEESQRAGVMPIELIDGEKLATRLKSLKLGVHVEMVEQISIDHNFFESL